jgi:2-hydroxychromene-2-carboxylate isomerase
MTRRPATPRLYFSFRSPYSWLSMHRLLAEVPDLFERFELFPYWDPDPLTEQALAKRGAVLPYQQMSKAKHLYVLVDIKRLVTRLGVAMAWPIDRDPWWELPHLGWLAARRAGAGQRCYAALATARWTNGLDICQPDVFRRAMDEAGLDGTQLLAETERDDLRAEGIDCLVAAYEDDVFGVPYLRLGRHRYWGFDRVEVFLTDLRAQREPVPAPVPAGIPVGSYDSDTAGGCG